MGTALDIALIINALADFIVTLRKQGVEIKLAELESLVHSKEAATDEMYEALNNPQG